MDRDRRLTGYLRGQTDNPTAPPGFELNNPWRVCIFPSAVELAEPGLTFSAVREAYHVDWLGGVSSAVHIPKTQDPNTNSNPNPRV
jgi:hypothetical protein